MAVNSKGHARVSRLSAEHVEILRARGIPLDLAEAAKLESADAIVASKQLGFDKPCSSGGLGIPYPNTCPPYWRIRLDVKAKDGARYLCPKRPVPIYVPPPYEADCPEDLRDVLVVVEAPLKALAMAAVGLSSIGLGGVNTTLEKGCLNDSWHPLVVKGKDVRILFDAGRATNEKVAAAERRLASALERAGANVRLCGLPLTSEGADQGPDDFLAAHGAEALYEIVRSATPASPWTRLLTPASDEWFTQPPPARKWLLLDARRPKSDGVLPLGKVGQLVAEGGAGKTMLLAQLAIAVSTGTSWLGAIDIASPGRVLLALGEEDCEEVRRRLYRGRRSADAPVPPVESIWTLPLAGEACSLVEADKNGNLRETDFCAWLRRTVADRGPWSLVVVDPLSRFAGADAETDNAAGTRYIQALESFAGLGPSVLGAHHTNKLARGKGGKVEAHSARGSSSIVDGSRWVATLTHEDVEHDDPVVRERLGEVVTLSFVKSNYSRKPEHIELRYDQDNGGALMPLDDTDRALVREARGLDPDRDERKAQKAKDEAERCSREDAALDVILSASDAPTSARGLRAAMAAALGSCSHDRADAAIARRRQRCS